MVAPDDFTCERRDQMSGCRKETRKLVLFEDPQRSFENPDFRSFENPDFGSVWVNKIIQTCMTFYHSTRANQIQIISRDGDDKNGEGSEVFLEHCEYTLCR